MLQFESGVGLVRMALDNQTVIAALDVYKSGLVQYVTDKILFQAQRIWK